MTVIGLDEFERRLNSKLVGRVDCKSVFDRGERA